MAIIKTSNYVDVYRIKALSKDIEAMSGRDRRSTDFVINRISSILNFQPEDSVLDIGCGDGTLLTRNADIIKYGMGVVPTDLEVDRLNNTYAISNIKFSKGLSNSLNERDGVFTKVICNSVIFILPSYEDLEKTISEISRVTKVGGTVYLGEVMIEDELAVARKEYGDSLLRWLIFTLRRRGSKAFFSAIKTLLKSLVSSEPFIIAPKKLLIVSPEEFIELCSKFKLKLIETSIHQLRSDNDEIYELPSRMNFLFSKIE